MNFNWEKKYGTLGYISHYTIEQEDDEPRTLHPAVGCKPVLLDGAPVHPFDIDPLIHEYLGTFRPPVAPAIYPLEGEVQAFYQKGVFDLLSYGTKKRGV